MFGVANKTLACYTFSVSWIQKFKSQKWKNFDEEENEDFCEEEYFNFEDLIFGEEKTFWEYFCVL